MPQQLQEDNQEHIAYHTCPFCEATCGLELIIKNNQVTRVRGDKNDVFSKGYFCPKGGGNWRFA